jgi:putative acetyltransferase
MRTAAAHRRKGVAAALVDHIVAEAHARGLTRLSLETGTHEFFAPARALYAGRGFVTCPPFVGYTDDPHSTFMTLAPVPARDPQGDVVELSERLPGA